MKTFRILQLITGIHYIHHYQYSYGFKLPFLNIAYFEDYGFKPIKQELRNKDGNFIKPYHNCTLNGY